MVVIVLVGGGFFGITRFAGMWGRGGEEGPEELDLPAGGQWQFERPGADDGVMGLNTVANEGYVLPALEPEEGPAEATEFRETAAMPDVGPAATESAGGPPEMEPQPLRFTQLLSPDRTETEPLGVTEVETEPVAIAEMDETEMPVEPKTTIEPAAVESMAMDVEPAMAAWESTEMAPEEMPAAQFEMEMDDPTEEFIESPAVADAEGIDAGPMVASMSVMGAAEEVEEVDDWPTETYESEPARTYVVSPPVAWAAEREPVIEPRPQEQPLVARPRHTAADGWGDLHGVIDATYVSRFIWRGYDAYANDHSAFQPNVDLDLFGTGFGINVWMSRANGSGFENAEWLTYTPYYKGVFFPDERYATYYKVGYTYFSYPELPRAGDPALPGTGAAQEVFGAFQWPNLLPGGIVPSYAMFAYWPSESHAANAANAGWAHVFGLNKDISFPTIWGNQPEQVVHLGAHTVYNAGVGPAGAAADHDWSHAVFSIATDFDLGSGLKFVPGFYYQSSWDDSINTSDEYWTSLSLSYSF
jgi:hypothetical protein